MPRKQSKLFHALVKIPKSRGSKYMGIIGTGKERERSRTKVKEGKDTITIEVTASDMASLRASFNAITRDIQVVEETEMAIGEN